MQTRRRTSAFVLCAQALACILGLGAAGAALAETIVVDDQVQVRESSVQKPKRGITMTQVEAKFGAPVSKHDAVGQPPITRWDYPGFSVFFEHDRVIHAVATGA
jgi:hypothetical protein